MTTDDTELVRRVGVSLSGGGNRAALFGAGALIALTDSSVNRDVEVVSSVSGGSMLNARLGSELDWRVANGEEVRRALRPLTQIIASGGFSWPGSVSFVLYTTFVIVIGFSAFLIDQVVTEGWSASEALKPVVLVAGLYFLCLVIYMLHNGRQRIILMPFHRILIGLRTKLSGLTHSGIRHVVCATDLETCEHFFFSGSGVDSKAWGHGGGDEVPIAFAVECSAAFPLVFPVKQFRTKKAYFDPDRKTPARLKLVDGGVHDNLGLPWLNEHFLTPDGEEVVVVVNSSWARPYRRLSKFKTARVFAVMHESNWLGRARSAQRDFVRDFSSVGRARGAVVSIGSSPFAEMTLIEEHFYDRVDDVAVSVQRRLASAREFLRSRYDTEHLEVMCRRAADTKTTLGRIAPERAAEVLLHGYLSTLALTHVLLDFPLPTPKDLDSLSNLTARNGALGRRCYWPWSKLITRQPEGGA